MSFTRARTFVLVSSLAAVFASAGCAADAAESGGAEMSRVRLYESVRELAADSDAIVVGRVVDEREVADIDPITDFTLADFEVDKVLAGDSVAAGSTIVVRQVGSSRQTPPVELLAQDGTYLLYLTASGLEGELGKHFYVTGANAGVYEARGAERGVVMSGVSDTFVQSSPQEGEHLPAEINISRAEG